MINPFKTTYLHGEPPATAYLVDMVGDGSGTPGTPSLRLLEDGAFRLLEDGGFRLLQHS